MNVVNIDKGQVDPSVLDVSLLFSQPLEVDWSAVYERMGFNGHIHVYKGTQCPECEKVVVTLDGFANHEEPDGTISYIETPGPMMNIFYPLSENKDNNNLELYAALCHELPICFVEYGDQPGFSLTGGGMDLSWVVAETYTRLGYLPPVWIELPKLSAGELNERELNIVRSMHRSYEEAIRLLSGRASDLRSLLQEA